MKLVQLVRLAGAGIIAGAAVATGVGAPGSPAMAAVPPVVIVEASSAFDSTPTKSATAECPSGTQVLGGGAGNANGGGVVHLSRLQALGNTDAFTASSAEHGVYAASWRVDVWAICGNLSGLEYISFHTGTSSDSFRSAVAECTGDRQLISTGGRVIGGDGQVILDDLMPSATFERVTVTAYEDDNGYAGEWSLFAYGVCADPIAGLELRSESATPIDSANDIVSAECSDGKQLLGLGGSINGALGRSIYSGLVPTDSTAFVFAQELQPGYDGNWFTRAYALCA
jgi:hypothetical protein